MSIYLPPTSDSGPHGRVNDVEGFQVLLKLVAQGGVHMFQPPVVRYVGTGCSEKMRSHFFDEKTSGDLYSIYIQNFLPNGKRQSSLQS